MQRKRSSAGQLDRRNVVKAGLAMGAACGALGIATPYPLRARSEEPVKLAMVEPLTGVYATLAAAEVEGARLALEEVNRSGGILGRPAQLLVEDSANDIAIGVAKTRQLIDRDQADFILGNVNSAIALAMTRVTALSPDRTYFNAQDHQLMSPILVGEVHPPSGPFDVFTPRAIVKAVQAAYSAETDACRLTFPS